MLVYEVFIATLVFVTLLFFVHSLRIVLQFKFNMFESQDPIWTEDELRTIAQRTHSELSRWKQYRMYSFVANAISAIAIVLGIVLDLASPFIGLVGAIVLILVALGHMVSFRMVESAL